MRKAIRRGIALMAVLLLPAGATAGGSWMTVTGSPSAEQQLMPPSEYTGEITVTFLGDCTLGEDTKKIPKRLGFARRIADNGMDFPFRELIRLTGEDDLTVGNLEGVLSDRNLEKSRAKKQFNFIGKAGYTEVLKSGSVECVTLANNHTMDFGKTGYADTKEALETAGICWFDADRPAIWESDDGLKIGFIGVGMSLSGSKRNAYRKQAKLLQEYGCSAVVTVMHAGTEYEYEPPDSYQKQITTEAVKVSDLIIGHHPHVVQGYSVLDGVPVVYSLGNCVFGGNTKPRDMDAMVVQAVMHFTEGSLDKTDLHFYPIYVTSDRNYNNYSPRFLTGKDAERVLNKLRKSTGNDPGEWNEETGAVVSFEAKGH